MRGFYEVFGVNPNRMRWHLDPEDGIESGNRYLDVTEYVQYCEAIDVDPARFETHSEKFGTMSSF